MEIFAFALTLSYVLLANPAPDSVADQCKDLLHAGTACLEVIAAFPLAKVPLPTHERFDASRSRVVKVISSLSDPGNLRPRVGTYTHDSALPFRGLHCACCAGVKCTCLV
ncbi:hypothetical protein LshimejAT787_1403210 [Lyophyllum shimeji]|uniref:Uncharacterized protein n=1 Tax=Lyophyllum shimeji TaxID=47721 RepID=A0A9P3UQD7_LYOSH|nr:hypothetical protein LshimejAT787_1403210 [Lyophyllum shimeji]